MKTSAYIIKDETIIATVETELKNGELVEFAYQHCEEKINASRAFNLINSKNGKISRARKWSKQSEYCHLDSAAEINDGEFLVS
jgi:hypothetical protein